MGHVSTTADEKAKDGTRPFTCFCYRNKLVVVNFKGIVEMLGNTRIDLKVKR